MWPHYLEKCKKVIFNNVIHIICASDLRMFRLFLNKMDYNCQNTADRRSLLIESVRSDLRLRGHNYGVCYTNVRSVSVTHDAPLEFSPCLNQPLPQLDHIPGYTLVHHVKDGIIHNLGQDCRMATC